MTALARTGRVRPTVVSFESVPLVGPPRLRGLQRAAIERSIEDTIRDGSMDPFAVMASVGPPGVATARLPFASGAAPGRGPDHGSVSRSVALLALGDRLTRAGRIPDLVHAHTGYPDGAAAAELAAALDRPLIITEHSSTVEQVLASPATRERYEAAVARAERIIAVSESLAAELRTGVAGLAPGSPIDLVVIPNAVPIEEFAGAVESERRPDELLFVGYRKPTKGIACLLRAFAQVRARRPAATLRLIGRSPTPEVEADWIALAAELGVSETVRFEGPADRAAVADALRRASVFVHPSPRETFGVVAVEALAAGTPV
ncbi:MAG TPA: glycosyltransferase, partial [Candidatus Acidoferrum sp.]|nr:glycosyltransferase [Candidatus Acidoferrum sp.]